jgi:hypothetical protein
MKGKDRGSRLDCFDYLEDIFLQRDSWNIDQVDYYKGNTRHDNYLFDSYKNSFHHGNKNGSCYFGRYDDI